MKPLEKAILVAASKLANVRPVLARALGEASRNADGAPKGVGNFLGVYVRLLLSGAPEVVPVKAHAVKMVSCSRY